MSEVLISRISRTDNHSTIECLEDGCGFFEILESHNGNDLLVAAREHVDHVHTAGAHLTVRFGPGTYVTDRSVPPLNTSMVGA